MARGARLFTVLGCLAFVAAAFAAQSPPRLATSETLKPMTPTYTHPANRYDVPTADARDNGGWVPDRAAAAPSVSVLDDKRHLPVGLQAGVQMSPGLIVCEGGGGGTSYDYQQNDDNQQMIATVGDPAGSLIHFAWTQWEVIPDSLETPGRYVAYNCYTPGLGLGLGDCGLNLMVGDQYKAGAGFPTVDVGSDDLGNVAFHARDEASQATYPPGPFSTYIFNAFAPCFTVWATEEFLASQAPEAIWPHLRIDRAGGGSGEDVFHVCSHPTGDHAPFDDEIFYWRRVGGFGNPWKGPVVLDQNAGPLNYHVATDPTSDKVAVFYERDDLNAEHLLQVGYIESPDNGADWIAAGSFPMPIASGSYVYITNYLGPEGDEPQAWLECHGEYDLGGRKHCVWIEQVFSNQTADCRLKHWDEVNGIHTIKQATGWDNAGGNGGRDLWLALPNLGFGDGSTTCNDGPGDKTNFNYVYITYEQYGGPTDVEQNDVSGSDIQQNLDIYMAISNDRGNTFSPSTNLTNTKSPGCDGTVPGQECSSERDPSLAHIVNDTLHILYILDTDAGDAVFGQGYWTYNPVMYLRIPGGTDSDTLCPEITPVFAAGLSNQEPGCEYHAGLTVPPLQQNETLTIENFGNATLTGTVTENPTADWLVMSGGVYNVAAAGAPDVRSVVMDATASSVTGEGLYQTTIEITHNDPSLTSPFTIPVDFFVFDEFYCPQYVVMHTGWLWLNVSNVERQGHQSDVDGGLSRNNTDSSYSVYDASLIIGRPPYEFDPNHAGLDTIVYRNIFGAGNGQPGFRALGDLVIDTSYYGTGFGYAGATAMQTTSDSVMSVDVEYDFPQNTDSSEFVLIKYKLYNRTASTISGLAVGQATDFDVTPSLHDADSLQTGSQNTGHLAPEFNLMYQQGADTAGHVVVGDRTATRFKAGITAIQCAPVPRGWIAPNDPWLFSNPGGGFFENYLWDEMTKSGLELFPPNNPDPEEDLHTVLVFEQNVDLGPSDVKHYAMAYVSSNTGTDDADLISTTKKAWKWAFGWQEFIEYDSLDNGVAATYPISAVGSHEDGLASGCCGCVFTKVNGDPEITLTDNGDCTGQVNFTGGTDTYLSAIIRVTTPCAGYADERVILLKCGSGSGPDCVCPYQADFNADLFLDAVDLNGLIDALFFGGNNPQDPLCVTTRGDFNVDGFPDASDLNDLIDHLFFGGPPPCNPCDPVGPACGP